METTSALQRDEHTLLGGIHELWLDGSWGLAIIVFVASIAVPVLKIGVLALLAWTVRWKPDWRRLERARLYRLIETGRPLVDARRLRRRPARRDGPLRAARQRQHRRRAVVVRRRRRPHLAATWSFDPRLIWREPPATPIERDGRRLA
jgi:uncharacterized paraquat-inducible protein A